MGATGSLVPAGSPAALGSLNAGMTPCPLRLGGLAATLGLVVSGCTQRIDMELVRGQVAESVEQQFGLEVAGVECPEVREARVDDVFECTATTAGGATVTFEVLQLRNGEASIQGGVTRGLLRRDRLAADIRAGLLAQGLDADVDCGPGYSDTAPGESFECEARGAERTATVVVTVQDRDGRVGWSLKGSPSS